MSFHMGNEWACDSDSDSTFHTWLQLWSCICLNSLPTKCCLYLLKLISIFGHFLTVNNRRYGRCYVKIFISPCTFLEFYTQLEANSAKSFRNAFCKCSRALDIMFLKTSYFWWMSSFFSLSSHLNAYFKNAFPVIIVNFCDRNLWEHPLNYSQNVVSVTNKHFRFELERKLNPWLKFEPYFLTWLPNGK